MNQFHQMHICFIEDEKFIEFGKVEPSSSAEKHSVDRV
jgi:hypothetical protein